MKNIIKKILFVICVFMIVFLSLIKVTNAITRAELKSAPNIGATIDKNDVAPGNTSAESYCVQHGTGASAGYDGNYKVIYYMELNRDTVKLMGENNYSKEILMNSDSRKLAYILSGNDSLPKYGWGSKGQTVRQFAIWFYMYDWMQSVGHDLGIDSSWDYTFLTNNENQIEQKLKNYYGNSSGESIYKKWLSFNNEANTYMNTGNPQIKNNGATEFEKVNNTENVLGPFNLKFNYKISQIIAKDKSGKKIDSQNITLCSNSDGTNQITMNDITSKSTFYIKSSGEDIESITFSITGKVYTAQAWFLSHVNSEYNTTSGGKGQSFIVVNSNSSDVTSQVTIKAKKVQKLKLKIIKLDEDTKKPLIAGFKIYYNNNGIGKWLYNSDTTPLFTDSNGELEIDAPVGRYVIYETVAPQGYELSEQKNYRTEQNAVIVGQITVTENTSYIEPIKWYNKKTETPPPTVTPKKGSLRIHKYDGNTNLTAGFRIKTDSGWLSGNNSSYTYNNTESNAEIYYTNNPTGYKTLTDLELGTYTVYEVTPPSGYNLEDQTGYENGKVYVDRKILTESQTSITFNKENKKTETQPPTVTPKKGSLQIHKYDGNAQLTAGFRIKTDRGWLRGNNGSYTYNNTESNAEIYYTNNPTGYKTLTDLELGTYTVYEVTPPSGYKLEDQTGYENGKVYVDRKTLTESQTSITFNKENKKTETPPPTVTPKKGSLQIHKYDGNTQLTAGFRIKTNSGWLSGNNGSYTYNNTESNAEIYYTNNPKGYKTLTDLELGTYTVYEVTPPFGYNLEDQTGYSNGKVYVGSKTLTETQTLITFEKENTKPEIPTGSLRIHKYDGNTNLTAGFRIKTDSGWLSGNNGSYTYNNTESNAEIYYTNSPAGYKTLTDLELGTYTVYEVTPPFGYNLEDQTGYSNGKVYVDSKTLTESQTEITFNKENIKIVKGNITISKHDGNTKLRAGFKIKTTTGWLAGNNGSYTYINSEENATKYYTDSSTGTVTINELELGSYTVYEVEAPEGYDITKQAGYSNGKIELGTKTLTENKTDISFSLENKKIVNVEGFVWVENPQGKANKYNDVYNSNSDDQLLSGITVKLYGNNGFITDTTTTNGHYKFSNIDNSLLTNGYVEFIYDNKTYVACHTLVGNDNAINSKAKEHDMQVGELEDDNLTGEGIAVTEQGKLTSYGYDTHTYTYSNINLGLKVKADVQHAVTETLEYVKVKMKGYTYTYKYGEEAVTTSPYAPTVSQQSNSAVTFEAKIYPSDVAYNVVNSTATDKLEMYVVYSMGVTNTTTTNINDIAVEQKLYLTSLTNTFDTARYVLSTEANGNNDTENSQFKLWNVQGNKATYNLNDTNSAYKDGIEMNKAKTTYIQFKIKDEAIQKMLNRTLRVEDIEKAPTVAEAAGFHEYLRADQVWVDSSTRKYNGAKGNAESPYYLHKSVTKSAHAANVYLKLTLGKTRTVSGTVFEDSVSNSDLKLGDGILNNNENKIENVTVELLNADKKTVTSLYKVDDAGSIVYQEGTTLPKAITKTNRNGLYSFDGLVPGYYYIRFTYGDGSQKIISATGEKSLTSNDYKSTIINTKDSGAGNTIQDAIERDQKLQDAVNDEIDEIERNAILQDVINNANWYENLNNQYSIAVDDLTEREKMDNYIYKSEKGSNGEIITKVYDKTGNVIGQFPMNVYSYSPMIGIPIETNANDSSEEKAIFERFSFGIIESPKTVVDVDLSISNITLTTQVGAPILSEDPINSRSKYLTSLVQNEFGKSKYAKMEIDLNAIYGSDLQVDYELTIKNNSEKDYIEKNEAEKGYYYKYGIITDSAEQKIVNIESVLNTIDSKYNIDSISKEIKVSGNDNEVKVNKGSDNTINIKDWGSLARNSKVSIGYKVTGLLTTDDDTGYINKAAVAAISLDKLTTLNSGFTWPGSDTEHEATITFTPPTGKDNRKIYIVSSIIGLVAICSGIVVLKKKVL